MSIKIILEKKNTPIPKKQDKTAVIVIGRFQPPHKGHGAIINAAKKAWRKNKYDAIIVFIVKGKETSKNKNQNPLSGESRKLYLKHSTFSEGVITCVVGNAFNAFIKCRELGYEPMCVVGGKFIKDEVEENRAEGYKKLLDKYFVDENGEPIDHKSIAIDRDKSSEGVAGVSGSIIRAAVIADRYDDFKEMVALDNNELVEKMFNELKTALSKKEKINV